MISKTGAERYFDEQMEDPEYRNGYETERRRINQFDSTIRTLAARREELGVSHSELARRANMRTEEIRRFFTSGQENPTLSTLSSVAEALGVEFQFTPVSDSTS